MAHIKGLDFIAITDHNSMKNLKAFKTLSNSYDFIWIPGVEITVSEGFDVLCYFKTYDEAMAFDQVLETFLIQTPMNTDFYYPQVIMNESDEEIETINQLLSGQTTLSICGLIEILKPFEHLLFYAHIDRKTKSGFAYMDRVKLNGIEVQNPRFKKNDFTLFNSDAHQILDVLEKTQHNQIELEEKSIYAFFKVFKYD